MPVVHKPLPLSIILPCYNPIAGWQAIITDSLTAIKQQVPVTELIIVNDGSSKNYIETEVKQHFAGYPEIKLISYPVNRGKGHALREGVKQATGEIIIYTDIDFPYTQESFMKIHSLLTSGQADVAIGIRNQDYYTHLPSSRVKISKFLRFLIKKLLRIPTDDTQCGLKGFNQKGKAVFMQTSIERYLFDLEFIFLSARKKLNIQTTTVDLRPEVHLSTMNWKILLHEGGNFLKIFLRSIFK